MQEPDGPRPSAGLTVSVLGCDGSWPGPGGAGSAYLFRTQGTAVLVDSGPGTLARLQGVLDPTMLDAVVISHRHADHWSDLPVLATFLRFSGRHRPLPVLAPAGLAQHTRLEGAPLLAWRVVSSGDRVGIGDLWARFHRTDHAGETLALRLDGAGRSVGYSADTGPGWSLAELGPGLDLAVCEATYTSGHEGTPGHMSGRQAGEQARRAGIPRIVLTHRWPTVPAEAVANEASAAFGAPVEQAFPGMEIRL